MNDKLIGKILMGLAVIVVLAGCGYLIGNKIQRESDQPLGFNNLQPNTPTTGGGSGSVGTLAQVTAQGATTNDLVALLGGVSTTQELAVDSTSTRWLGFVNASGTYITAGTVDMSVAVKCLGVNCRQALMMAGQSATPSPKYPAATATLITMPTNGQTVWGVSYGVGLNAAQWSTPMPNNWDGGTLSCHLDVFSTSTPTFTAVYYNIRAMGAAPSSTMDQPWGASSSLYAVNNNAANVWKSTTDTTLTVGGSATGTNEVWFEVSRLAAGPATTTSNVKAVECTYSITSLSAL